MMWLLARVTYAIIAVVFFALFVMFLPVIWVCEFMAWAQRKMMR